MSEDESPRGCSSAIEALDDLVKVVGPVLVDKSIEPIVSTIQKLLEGEINEDDS